MIEASLPEDLGNLPTSGESLTSRNFRCPTMRV